MRLTTQKTPLGETLERHVHHAAPELIEDLGEGRIRCYACGHRCKIRKGMAGVCRVRFNADGGLSVPWGYVAGVAVDPIEKKPFFHVLPGSDALSFGMLGCDLHCSYCQNWITSQALRDPDAVAPIQEVNPERLAEFAVQRGAPILSSTYNEPLITSEWAVEIFKAGKARGLYGSYVSNGNGTPEVLRYLRPFVDFYKVDLKTFNDQNYRRLGAPLENIKETIRLLKEMDFWVEVVTLLITGFNDSDEELKQMTDFLSGVSPDIPWHVTAFHPDYHMQDPPSTRPEQLYRAAEIGKNAGLRFIYLGNIPGRVGEWENTRCPACGATLVERIGFHIRSNRITDKGACPDCGAGVPGVWHVGAASESGS